MKVDPSNPVIQSLSMEIDRAILESVKKVTDAYNLAIELRLTDLVEAGVPLSEIVVEQHPWSTRMTDVPGVIEWTGAFRIKLKDQS